MKYSILQSVYRNDNFSYFNECLKSYLNLSLKPEKIILIKDGLIPHELEDVINKYINLLPIQVVGYEDNQGLAHALNYGLQFVETEYVARMDSDDICCSDRFKKQIEFFENNPDVEICGTGLNEFYIDKNGVESKKIRLYPEKITKQSKCLFKGTPLGHPTVMIKTSLLKKYGYNENTKMNEDIDLWFRILKDGYVIYNLQEPLLNFRITDSTFKRRSVIKAKNEFSIYFKNLYSFFGFNVLLVFPLLRFITRFLPRNISKKMYFSKLRRKLFNNR